MKIQFLGAAGTVTGSKYLLTHRETKVLVDCGLFQGYKNLRLKNWNGLSIDIHQLDAVVLTHAHLDHSGFIPLLIKNGYRGPIYPELLPTQNFMAKLSGLENEVIMQVVTF